MRDFIELSGTLLAYMAGMTVFGAVVGGLALLLGTSADAMVLIAAIIFIAVLAYQEKG
jgi:hypothetical protein